MHFFYTLILFILTLLTSLQASACTGIMLKNTDGTTVHGRTLEFGMFVDTSILAVPRGYNFIAKIPLGNGMQYASKYAAIGTMAFKDFNLLDGLNEKGLAVGTFYFPTFASYTPITAENQTRALSPADFSNWILTQFATVDEVKQAIAADTVIIAPTVLSNWGNTPPPFHYIVYDKTGASIAIEPLNGKLIVTDNPLGVFTNSPNLDWHMTNLRNYIALNPRNVPKIEVNGVVLKQLGQGNGMLGLPGDFSPPARFTRAAIFSTTAIASKSSDEGILQIFHILNNFDIPVGVARQKADGVLHTDYTILTVARDPQNLRYYYRSYDDQTIRMVDLKQFDLNMTTLKSLSTAGKQPIINMSDKLT